MVQRVSPRLTPFQTEALRRLERERIDLICVAPTGSGKGVILEELALRSEERILVFTPLVALARQQKARFENRGVLTLCTPGREDPLDVETLNRVQAWVLSPESLQGARVQRAIDTWKPAWIVVDECHCVADWGEDFRPAYGELPAWIARHTDRTLWMTATLPRTSQVALERKLGRPMETYGTFGFPPGLELGIQRVSWIQRAQTLLDFVADRPTEGGVLFAQTRAGTERLARLLEARLEKNVFPYHAGLSQEERRALEGQLSSRNGSLLTATSAFGMGMDYASLDWSLQWQVPLSLLSLAQSAGRVGRAGRRGQAEVFWDEEDFRMAYRLKPHPRTADDLHRLRHYLEENSEQSRHQRLKEYFV